MKSNVTNIKTAKSHVAHGEIFNAVVGLMNKNEWHFEEQQGGKVIALGLRGDEFKFEIHFVMDEESKILTIRSFFSQPVPYNRIAPLLYVVNHINLMLRMGSFRLDIESGTIFLNTALEMSKIGADSDVIGEMLQNNLGLFEHFGINFLKAMVSETDSVGIIEEVFSQKPKESEVIH